MADEVFPNVEIETARLRLRQFTETDAADVHAAWQDERYVSTAPVNFPLAGAGFPTALEWCTNGVEKNRLAGRSVELAVAPREGGRLVGHVALFSADWVDRVAEVHYWTAPWARGSGYAAEAARAVSEWALRDVAYERINLHAATGNAASRHVAVSAGFHPEGVLRSRTRSRTGGRLDLAVYSLIRADIGL